MEADVRLLETILIFPSEPLKIIKEYPIKNRVFRITLPVNPSGDKENRYFGGLALVHYGQRREGRELMRRARLPEDFLRKIRTIIR